MTTATTPAALDLRSPYPLHAQHARSYRRDGHILLRGVASPDELAVYRPAIVETAMRLHSETRPLADRDTYGKAFLQIDNLWERDAAVARFVLAERFARLAADLMGVDGVRILHDQALFKEPGVGIKPWHQDQIYWPLDTTDMITMWLPLVDVPEEIGSMTFVSGSHQAADYRTIETIFDHSESAIAEYVRAQDLPKSSYGAMRAGDATWHAGWTMHRAPGNHPATVREVMTVIYFADGARITDLDTHPSAHGWVREWYPGLDVGDLLAHDRAPLVYTNGFAGQ